MSRAYDALMKELEDEQNAPSETPNTETPPAPEEHVEDSPNPASVDDPKPAETPAETPAEEKPEDTPAPAETPVEQPAPQKKPSEYTPEERAQFAFNRQLAKERQKHQAELEEIKANFQKQIDELKKSAKPSEPKKTRADFENDDQFIDYLVQQRYEKERAADAEERAKQQAEQARQQAEKDEAQRMLEAEQQAWLSNVDSAFREDAKGKQAFLSRLQTCMDKGLGAVLDACPTASEFLLRSAGGPKVLAHLINDRAAFERVFNERSTPLDSYYELRQIEAELKAQQTAAPQPTPASQSAAPQNFPHLGKPGKGGNATEPDIFSDEKAMRSFLRSGR